MPHQAIPRSDRQRIAFLKRALATGMQDIANGANFVSQETLNTITAFLPDLETRLEAVSARLSARTKETGERLAAAKRVKTYTRDLWDVLKRRVNRLEQPASVLEFYGLPLSGNVPKPTSAEEWLTLAGQVIRGDAQAVAAGYPPMMNPSADELRAVLEAARREAGDAPAADRTLDESQEAIAALRPKADGLIREVMSELRFNLRNKDAPSQRRIMRTYGVQFRYPPGESADQDEPGTGVAD